MLNYFKQAMLISLMSLLFISYSSAEINEQDSDLEQAQVQTPLSEDEATAVVLSYLDALSQGDTLTIKQLIDGNYLEKRRGILDNPNYTNTLSRMYSNANSEILGTEYIDDQQQRIAVDTLIELSKDEILQSRFIITRVDQELKIVEEVESAN